MELVAFKKVAEVFNGGVDGEKFSVNGVLFLFWKFDFYMFWEVLTCFLPNASFQRNFFPICVIFQVNVLHMFMLWNAN